MNQIGRLEAEIRECQNKIQELKQEQEKLEKVKYQNQQIANSVQQHISSRRNHAGKFYQYNSKTTIAKLIAGKMENNYSHAEEIKLLGNYDEIEKEVQSALWQIEQEIVEESRVINMKQRRIEEIREEERRLKAYYERVNGK